MEAAMSVDCHFYDSELEVTLRDNGGNGGTYTIRFSPPGRYFPSLTVFVTRVQVHQIIKDLAQQISEMEEEHGSFVSEPVQREVDIISPNG